LLDSLLQEFQIEGYDMECPVIGQKKNFQ